MTFSAFSGTHIPFVLRAALSFAQRLSPLAPREVQALQYPLAQAWQPCSADGNPSKMVMYNLCLKGNTT